MTLGECLHWCGNASRKVGKSSTITLARRGTSRTDLDVTALCQTGIEHYKISRISSYRLKGGIKYAPASSVRAQASMSRATPKPRSRADAPAASMDLSKGGGITM